MLRYVVVAVGAYFISSGAETVSAQRPLFELVHSKCSVLQNILDEMAADFADPQRRMRRDERISRSIVDRLNSAAPETVDRFFRCFELEEVVLNGHAQIVSFIPVAKLNIPTTPEEKEFRQVLVHARLLAYRTETGFQIDGRYEPGY